MLAVNSAGSVSERFDLGDLMMVGTHVDLQELGEETGKIFREGEREIEANERVYDRNFARDAYRIAVKEGGSSFFGDF